MSLLSLLCNPDFHLFKRLDKNKNGFIDKQESKDNKEISNKFDRFSNSIERDGQLSLDEFFRLQGKHDLLYYQLSLRKNDINRLLSAGIDYYSYLELCDDNPISVDQLLKIKDLYKDFDISNWPINFTYKDLIKLKKVCPSQHLTFTFISEKMSNVMVTLIEDANFPRSEYENFNYSRFYSKELFETIAKYYTADIENDDTDFKFKALLAKYQLCAKEGITAKEFNVVEKYAYFDNDRKYLQSSIDEIIDDIKQLKADNLDIVYDLSAMQKIKPPSFFNNLQKTKKGISSLKHEHPNVSLYGLSMLAGLFKREDRSLDKLIAIYKEKKAQDANYPFSLVGNMSVYFQKTRQGRTNLFKTIQIIKDKKIEKISDNILSKFADYRDSQLKIPYHQFLLFKELISDENAESKLNHFSKLLDIKFSSGYILKSQYSHLINSMEKFVQKHNFKLKKSKFNRPETDVFMVRLAESVLIDLSGVKDLSYDPIIKVIANQSKQPNSLFTYSDVKQVFDYLNSLNSDNVEKIVNVGVPCMNTGEKVSLQRLSKVRNKVEYYDKFDDIELWIADIKLGVKIFDERLKTIENAKSKNPKLSFVYVDCIMQNFDFFDLKEAIKTESAIIKKYNLTNTANVLNKDFSKTENAILAALSFTSLIKKETSVPFAYDYEKDKTEIDTNILFEAVDLIQNSSLDYELSYDINTGYSLLEEVNSAYKINNINQLKTLISEYDNLKKDFGYRARLQPLVFLKSRFNDTLTNKKVANLLRSCPVITLHTLINISEIYLFKSFDELSSFVLNLYDKNPHINFDGLALSYNMLPPNWQKIFKENTYSNGKLDLLTDSYPFDQFGAISHLYKWFDPPTRNNLQALLKRAEKIVDSVPDWKFSVFFQSDKFNIQNIDDYTKLISGNYSQDDLLNIIKSQPLSGMTLSEIIRLYPNLKEIALNEYKQLSTSSELRNQFNIALCNLGMMMIVGNTAKDIDHACFIDIGERLIDKGIITSKALPIIKSDAFWSKLRGNNLEANLPLSSTYSLAIDLEKLIPSDKKTSSDIHLQTLIDNRKEKFGFILLDKNTEVIMHSYNVGDIAVSAVSLQNDSFNDDSYKKLFRKAGINTFYYKRGGSSIQETYDKIEKTDNKSLLILSGHASDEEISMGSHSFKVEKIFSSLKKRVINLINTGVSAYDINNTRQLTMIYNSCYSYGFFENLYKLWRNDDELRSRGLLPPNAILAGSESLPSLKLSSNSIFYLTKIEKEEITVKDWVKYVEPYSFILYDNILPGIIMPTDDNLAFIFPDETFWTSAYNGEIN